MDQLQCMRVFSRVAELGSFARAANTLDLSRAMASAYVAQLEKHLGTRLLHRTTRRVTVSPQGAVYLEHCQRILAELQAADDQLLLARNRPQGKLRVDVPMAFGKHLLLPIFGHTLFAWLTGFAKNLHNFVAPLFIVTLPIFILIYVKDNLPEKGDVKWMLNAWKLFLGRHMPSGKFNAGEKAWFWGGVVFLSLTLCVSGVVLLFPNFEQLRSTMQQAHVVHVIAAVLVIAAALGHIYLGTIGMDGAYRNMRDGVTDETWAKEHHENWYNDVKSGKAPGDASAKPTGAPQTQH